MLGENWQQEAETDSANDWISLDLGPDRDGVDVIADVSGSATLTVEVSTTGQFNGEEHTPYSIPYSSSGVYLEGFDFRHRYVRVKLDSNVNELEMVSRGV
jgi:hypothetical protein